MTTTTNEPVETPERQWPVVVTLQHPIDFGSQHITQLTFRRGRMGDLKGISLDGIPPTDQLMLLASRLSGQILQVIEKLDPDDTSEVLEIVLGFFARCLGSGQRGSR